MKFLFDTNQPKFLYILKAAALSLFVAIIINAISFTLFPYLKQPEVQLETALNFLLVGLIVPFLETILMWPVITILKRFSKPTLTIALISATIWAVLHSLNAPIWGVVIFFSFVVFSISFVEWQKVSTVLAILITFGIHAVQNSVTFGLAQLY